MTTCKTKCMITAIKCWNNIYDAYHTCKDNINSFFRHVMHYFKKDYTHWYIMSDHMFPLSYMMINNKNVLNDIWIYDSKLNILYYDVISDISHNTSHNVSHNIYKLTWLSAKICIQYSQEEYNIDEFIYNLRIASDDVPTLRTLLTAWCIQNMTWFYPLSSVSFYIIDEFGDENVYSINMYDNNIIKDKKSLKQIN